MTTTAIAEGSDVHRRVLVIGGGDVGSAIAHLLFLHGLHVLIAERPHSAHARRGMAFTDALFDGQAMLADVEARLQTCMADVERCWHASHALPIVTLPESQLLDALRFDVLVEATMRRNAHPADLRAMARMTIGVGPGYVPAHNCHVAIESRWGEDMGTVLWNRAAAARSGGPRPLDGVTRERFGVAPLAGQWRTAAVLGQQVRAGETLGGVGDVPVAAPIAGTLRGLSRDGVAVMPGQRVLEVDPRHVPEIHGLGERPRAIAKGVAQALGLHSATTSGAPA